MKRTVLNWLLLGIIAGAVVIVANVATDPAAVAAAGKTAVVTMTDQPPTFVPPKLTIKAGTTVEWKNTGKSLHDVTTDPSMAQNKDDVAMPAGAKPFDSGFMAPGATWSYTFTVPGHYTYVCIPHEKDHMIGHIMVKK
ncbi:MAG: cupredoxin domain-containing protein [Candidatus Binataceae bacterium]